MGEWTKQQIEEGDYYGVHLHNKNEKPMVSDLCELCHSEYTREVTEEYFPRYCEKCLEEKPEAKENERRKK